MTRRTEKAIAMLDSLEPEEWREVLLAVFGNRCLACGQDADCLCSDIVDHAKLIIARRAQELT